MSERTKFFADKEAGARKEQERRAREEQAAKNEMEARDRAFAEAAALYEMQFSKLCDELREDGLRPQVTRGSSVITAKDAHTGETYSGNVYLQLSFKAGEMTFEIVYLGVQAPVLGMLAWRRDRGDYFVGPQSKAAPGQLAATAHIVAHHLDRTLDAMKAG